MRTQLTIACLVAMTSAVNLSKSMQTELAQRGLPSLPAQFEYCGGCCTAKCPPVEEEPVDNVADVTEDAVDAVDPIGTEVVEESGVEEALANTIGEEEASEIVKEVIDPIIDEVIADEILDVNSMAVDVENLLPFEQLMLKIACQPRRQ